jgi:hypothetical protein
MDRHLANEINSAKTFAYLTFIGIISPLFGILFGIISKSKLDKITPVTDEDVIAIEVINNVANKGMILSVFILILSLAAAYIYLV